MRLITAASAILSQLQGRDRNNETTYGIGQREEGTKSSKQPGSYERRFGEV